MTILQVQEIGLNGNEVFANGPRRCVSHYCEYARYAAVNRARVELVETELSQTGESFLHTVPSSCAAFFLFPSWPYHSIIEKDRRSHLRSSNFGIDTYRDISSGFSQQGLTSIKIQFFPSSWCCMANAPSHEESSTWKCIRRTYDWGK